MRQKPGGTIISRLRRNTFLTSRSAILFHPAYLIRRALFNSIKSVAPTFQGALLDFGCGSKPYRSLFTGVNCYIGVDVAVSGHDHLTSDIDVLYDGNSLPFDDCSFEGVVAFEVFEHVFNLSEMLNEIGRVLRPGGRLMFTVPFAWPEHEQPYDFARYTSFGMRHVLESAGYIDIKIEKSNDSVSAIGQLAISYLVDQVIPLSGVFSRPIKVLTVPFLNLATVILVYFMPRRDEIYSNLVVQAIRP